MAHILSVLLAITAPMAQAQVPYFYQPQYHYWPLNPYFQSFSQIKHVLAGQEYQAKEVSIATDIVKYV